MQRMLNEEDEDQVEAYYKEKYASGHTTRYNTVHVHDMTCTVHVKF